MAGSLPCRSFARFAVLPTLKTSTSIFLGVVVLVAARPVSSQFLNDPAAVRVLGAADFTTVGSAAATAEGIQYPSSVAIDPLTGKLFVVSGQQNRVLRFPAAANLANGGGAEAVFGQANFFGTDPGSTFRSFKSPSGIHVDAKGRLWVADAGNNRVLMFPNASTVGSGATPVLVLGQPDFNTYDSAVSQNRMYSPTCVFVDSLDNLWVGEAGSYRILKFSQVSSLANGAPAAVVLGQPDFTTNTYWTTGLVMFNPAGLAVDGAGRLWVADSYDNRVLRFDNAASLANGAEPTGVLVQPKPAWFATNTAANRVYLPQDLLIDPNGTLFVADSFNNRVLYFKNAAEKGNGALADGMIGQTDYSMNISGTTERKLHGPSGLALDKSGVLWVADLINHRVVGFQGDYFVSAPTVQRGIPKTTKFRMINILGSASDQNGIREVRYRVGNSGFRRAKVKHESDGWTPWGFMARLDRGPNRIEIIAVDTFNNISPPKRLRVTRR